MANSVDPQQTAQSVMGPRCLLRYLIRQQGFSLASPLRHSPKIVPDVQEFAVQFGQFVRDDFRKHTQYGNAQ